MAGCSVAAAAGGGRGRARLMALDLARPVALWLLALVPLLGLLGWGLGVRLGRMAPAAVWLRMAAVALIVVALAQPLLAMGGGSGSTVFVLDGSRSVGGGEGAAAAWIRAALGGAGAGDRAAVIAFGAAPKVAAPAGPAGSLGPGWDDPSMLPEGDRENTDIERALGLARALPLGGARRIVLLSDGAENAGSAMQQAAQAAAEGVPIDVLPLPGVVDDDLRLSGASAPKAVWQGESVSLLANVVAPEAGIATVEVWADGALLSTQDAEVQAGANSLAFTADRLGPGFHALEVRVRAPGAGGDGAAPEPDAVSLPVVVRGQPNLLLISPEGVDPALLRGSLERGGAKVTVVAPAGVPSRLSELGRYDGFVLDDVPADALTLDQVAGLQEATRTLGRGLVAIGGAASFGPGGYAGTRLEATLPVTVKVTDGRQRQRVALLLIVDKSGSMSYDPLGGNGKIELAKDAVSLAARSLAEGDQVGVLLFNDQQQWAVPMTTIGGEDDRKRIDQQIGRIEADGGTELLPALEAGLEAIDKVDADARHIILLSDGKSRTGEREDYLKALQDGLGEGTTLSTIAIGEDADTDLLNFLADQGGGRYHFTAKPEDIPRVTLEEAQSVGSQSVVRGAFPLIQTAPSPIMAGFDPANFPSLDGYDFAETKPEAQTILASGRDDPVLAVWQYGLGRVVAWTADDGRDYSARWASWPEVDQFWAGMIRWALPDPENRPLLVDVTRDGRDAVISVTTAGDDAPDAALGALTATITSPSGGVLEDVALVQSGPGAWQVRVAAPEPGAYQIDLTGEDGLRETAGFAVPASPELQPDPGGAALLAEIARQTGGRVLRVDEPAAAFSPDGLTGTAARAYRPFWPLPLALALAALVAEVAVRTGAWRRLRTRLRGAA
ncbi:MAG: VWA domain-containing protein [Thermomicrobiales bacterium]